MTAAIPPKPTSQATCPFPGASALRTPRLGLQVPQEVADAFTTFAEWGTYSQAGEVRMLDRREAERELSRWQAAERATGLDDRDVDQNPAIRRVDLERAGIDAHREVLEFALSIPLDEHEQHYQESLEIDYAFASPSEREGVAHMLSKTVHQDGRETYFLLAKSADDREIRMGWAVTGGGVDLRTSGVTLYRDERGQVDRGVYVWEP